MVSSSKAKPSAKKATPVKPATKTAAPAPVAKTVKPAKAVEKKAPPAKKEVAPPPTPKVVTPSVEPPKAEAPAKPIASMRKPSPIKPRYDLVHPTGKKPTNPRIRIPKEGQHFSDEDLADFRKRLLGMREEILEQLRATRAEALRRSDEENLEEDGTNSFARSADLSRADEQNKRLHAIDDALRAIDSKTYGICSMCGCLIPRDRLRAAPFAIRCVNCKREYEATIAADKRRQDY